MATRIAKFSDISGIIAVLRDAYERSRYADGFCDFDEREARRIAMNAIQRHGHKTEGGTYVAVGEQDGQIESFVIGITQRVYHVGMLCMATDLFWLATERSSGRDPLKLMQGMVAWARWHPLVIEVQVGTTAILQDPRRAGLALKRMGLEPYGHIYRMEIAA